MSVRLASLDPTAVPLPHGTEVSTRVDRVHGERVVPMGAIGRVVSSEGERVEVRVVGVGVMTFARHELIPRKVGQARYAERRAAAWEALLPCVVLEATVGSRAWGLAEAGSDTDKRGVFALPFTWCSGLAAPPEDLVSHDASTTYWSLEKAVRQGIRADPNTLEALFVPSVRALDPVGQWLLEAREAFVSVEIYGAFGRYAISQLDKLAQSLRLAEHRALVLAWLREDPDLTLDATARRLADAVVLDAASAADALLRAKQYIKQLYRSLYDQGLVPSRDLDALKRFALTDPAALELPRELRPKNAYNLLRLLRSAIDWLRTGEPHLVVSGTFRQRLLSVKRGEVPLAEVLAEAEAMTPELEEARRTARVPARADLVRADALLRRAAHELARRHIERAPGPLGLDAPPVPPLVLREVDTSAADVPEAADPEILAAEALAGLDEE